MYDLSPCILPQDLVLSPIPFFPLCAIPYTKMFISRRMYTPLLELFSAANAAGCELYGISGYRSYYRQSDIFEASAREHGYLHACAYVAKPGLSEHHTGLALDLSCPAIDFKLEEEFAHTREGRWIDAHAGDFGFRLTYKNDSYFAYEPWHIFYES